jgi:branched-chain amino acid transport system substrate-binding protein
LMDITVKMLDKAGANLSSDSFVKALETSTIPRSFFGTPEVTFTPNKRLGNNSTRIAQIIGGRWTTISDFVK